MIGEMGGGGVRMTVYTIWFLPRREHDTTISSVCQGPRAHSVSYHERLLLWSCYGKCISKFIQI